MIVAIASVNLVKYNVVLEALGCQRSNQIRCGSNGYCCWVTIAVVLVTFARSQMQPKGAKELTEDTQIPTKKWAFAGRCKWEGHGAKLLRFFLTNDNEGLEFVHQIRASCTLNLLSQVNKRLVCPNSNKDIKNTWSQGHKVLAFLMLIDKMQVYGAYSNVAVIKQTCHKKSMISILRL